MHWVSHYSRVTGKPSPAGLDFAVYNSISEVPVNIWNNCGGSLDVFLSPQYLFALEKAPPENMEFRYVIFSDNKTPVAIAYFQILELNHRLHIPAAEIFSHKEQTIISDIHSKIGNTLSLRILVCGNSLLSGEHGYAAVIDDENKVLHAIVEAAYVIKRAEKENISVTMVKDFYDSKKHQANILSRYGYYSFDAGPNMVVPIRDNWVTFEDYLKEMKPKYRKRVTGAIKKGTAVIRRSLALEDILKYKNELHALYCEVVDKSKYRLFVLSPDYFAELKRNLGERFICDAYFHGETIIGFTTRIFNGKIIEGYTHGLNYSVNKTFELYQNFMIDDIRAAITAKSSRINTGRTSVAMKSSVGAIADAMKCYMRFSNRLSNQFIKPLFYFIKPSDEHCRNPFEDD